MGAGTSLAHRGSRSRQWVDRLPKLSGLSVTFPTSAASDRAKGNLEEAVRLYRAAYELRADQGLLFNIARVMHKQGQSETAVAYYEQFLSSASEDVAQKRKAQTFLEQLLRPDGSRPSPPPPVRPQTPILSPESSSNVIHTTTPLIGRSPRP